MEGPWDDIPDGGRWGVLLGLVFEQVDRVCVRWPDGILGLVAGACSRGGAGAYRRLLCGDSDRWPGSRGSRSEVSCL